MDEMNEPPKTIFLQWQHEDWHEWHDGITWSVNKEFDNDIQYIAISEYQNVLSQLIAAADKLAELGVVFDIDYEVVK